MIEPKRGCGYRKVNGLYLVGKYISVSCDRLPLPLTTCPVCGQGIKVNRGFTEINPFRLWGPHDNPGHSEWFPNGEYISGSSKCFDTIRPCKVCDPKDQPAYIMLVGEKYYTPESFLDEAHRMGICKRIPFIPKKLIVGETVIYLAHNKAVEVREAPVMQQVMAIIEEGDTNQPQLLEAEKKPTKALGIFCAFIPQGIEQLIKESEATPEKLESLKKRGIKAVIVPDEDKDHA